MEVSNLIVFSFFLTQPKITKAPQKNQKGGSRAQRGGRRLLPPFWFFWGALGSSNIVGLQYSVQYGSFALC